MTLKNMVYETCMDRFLKDTFYVLWLTPVIYLFTLYYPGLTSLFSAIMIVQT